MYKELTELRRELRKREKSNIQNIISSSEIVCSTLTGKFEER